MKSGVPTEIYHTILRDLLVAGRLYYWHTRQEGSPHPALSFAVGQMVGAISRYEPRVAFPAEENSDGR